MRVGLLGRPALYTSEGPRVLTGNRESCLLAVLAAHQGRTVRAAQLEEELWDGRRVSEATLRVAVNRLRHRSVQLTGVRLVESEPGGYRLAVGPHELDATRYCEQVREAQAARAGGAAGSALATLDRAEGMWRGEPYDGFAHLESVRPQHDRLLEVRWAAMELRAAIMCELGDHGAALEVLDELLARQPLREPAWALRMVALARTGRAGDALSEFERLSSSLQRELGVAPGAELLGLRRAIVEGRPAGELEASLLEPRRGGAMPRRSTTRKRPFVARRAELARLHDAAARAMEGSLQVVVVSGEQGIGKSALLHQFAAERAEQGSRSLSGRCGPSGSVPLRPVLEALDPFVGAAGGPGGVELARLVSQPQPERRSVDEMELARYRVLKLLGEVAAVASRPGGAAMCLDDMQWADPMSIAFLDHAISALAELPLVVVAAARTPADDPGRLGALIANASRSGNVEYLDLQPLAAEELDVLLDAELSGEERARIHRASGGNPLYALQLRRLMVNPGGEVGQLGDLQRFCAARIGDVSPRTLGVLRAAAVFGDEFDIGAVAALVEQPLVEISSSLAEALTAGLVEPTEGLDRYRFVHGVMQRVVLSEVDRSTRAHLHLAAGHWLQGAPEGRRGEIAAHLEAARPLTSDIEVATALLAAGSEALALGDHHGARWIYGRIGDLRASQPSQRTTAAIGLGLGLAAAGERAGASAVLADNLEEARRLGHWEVVADTLIARSGLGVPSSIPEAVAEARSVDDALGQLPEDDHRRRGALACWKADLLVNIDVQQSADAIRMAEACAAACNDAPMEGLVACVRLRQAEAACEPPERCVMAAQQLVELAEACGNQVLALRAGLLLQGARLRAGDLDAVRADEDRFTSTNDPVVAMHSQLVGVGLATASEPMDTIEERSRSMMEGQPNELVLLAATARVLHLSLIRWEQVRLVELEPLLVQSLATSPRRLARPLVAACRLEAGDVDGARDQLTVFAGELSALSLDWSYLATLAFGAEVAAAAGDQHLGQEIDALLASHGPQNVVACSYLLSLGQLDRYRGMLAAQRGALNQAVELFGNARTLDAASGARLWAGWAACGEAEVRLRRGLAGDREAAAELLDAAAATAHGLGSLRLSRNVDEQRRQG